MHVDVVGDAGAGALAEVHPEVDALGLVGSLDGLLGLARQHHQLGPGGVIGLGELGDVAVGRDHQMPAGIRIDIQQNEIIQPAVEDQVLFVLVLFDLLAEDAPGSGLRPGYVAIAPGTPEIIHRLND